MSIYLFVFSSFLLLFFLYIVFRKSVKSFVGDDVFIYCLVLMMASILNYPTYIQYGARVFAVFMSWFVIIYKTRLKFIIDWSIGSKLTIPFLIYSLLSTSYSYNFFVSFFKVTEVLTDFILLNLIWTKEGREQFIKKIFFIFICFFLFLLLITALGFELVPSVFSNSGYSASKSFLGVRIGNGIIGANTASALSVICFSWLFLTQKKIGLFGLAIIIISLFCMLFAQSRTTIAIIPIVLLLRLFKKHTNNTFGYFIFICCIICVFINNLDNVLLYLKRGQTVEQLTGFSGRVEMTRIALDFFYERLIGYGYGVGSDVVSQFFSGRFIGIQHLHNALLETLVDTGIIGTLLLFVQVIYCYMVILINTLKSGLKNNMIDVVLLIFFTLRSITSLGVGNWHSVEILLWYYMLISLKYGNGIQNVFNDDLVIKRNKISSV